jgi:hypothetical protein
MSLTLPRSTISLKRWGFGQLVLFVLCQEHSTLLKYLCWLNWRPIKIDKTMRTHFFVRMGLRSLYIVELLAKLCIYIVICRGKIFLVIMLQTLFSGFEVMASRKEAGEVGRLLGLQGGRRMQMQR